MTSEDGDGEIVEFKDISPDGMDPAKPRPAHKCVPEWYENLGFEGAETGEKTVKNCIPFMEAMTIGWIVPIPMDIALTVDDDGLGISIDRNRELVDPHALEQLGGDDHPMLPQPIIKFMTPWVPETPDGYSMLYLPPMNRSETRFKPFSGVVDTDTFGGQINIPSLWLEAGYEGTIERGTPLVQAIPFEREAVDLDGLARTATDEEKDSSYHFFKGSKENDSFYQNNFWTPKRKGREISK